MLSVMMICALLIALLIISVSSSDIYFQIPEKSPTGTIIGKLADVSEVQSLISDAKSVQFDLLTATFSHGLLNVNSKTGALTTTTELDRERICTAPSLTHSCVISLHVQLMTTSKDGQSHSKLLRVQVEVLDKNDNSPRFTVQQFELQVPENSLIGTTFDLPLATDADTKKYGVTKYVINDTDRTFIMITSVRNGVVIPQLKQKKALDREKQSSYTYTLTAFDSDNHSGKLQIRVILVDVNDNAPVWSKVPDTIEVNECKTRGEPLLTLRATDADEGSFGQIRYSIANSGGFDISHIFYVNGDELYASENPDYEKVKKVEISLVAKDGGQLQTTKTLTVIIKDCNDHRPRILIHPLRRGDGANLRIRENEKEARSIATILVTDDDDKEFGETECSIDATQYFQLKLNSASGSVKPQVYYLMTLPSAHYDREEHQRLTVTITCTDRALSPNQLTSSRQIIVDVEDENDNSPTFRQSVIRLKINENNHIGDLVGSVIATDPDSGQNGIITYILHPSKESKAFRIDGQGNLRALKSFDREVKDLYRLKVIAQDNGHPQRRNATATVLVQVLDENDNAPEFHGNYQYEVTESRGSQRLASVLLGRINATDPDNGRNGSLRFELSDFIPSRRSCLNCFLITPDGRLRISGRIDREKNAQYRFKVKAFDQGRPKARTSSTWVTVNILDLNDNLPRFTFPLGRNKSVDVDADTPVNQQIAQVVAEDPDEGENAKVIFTMPVTQRMFTMHEDGRITLKRSLLGEGGRIRQRSYKLVINAKNPGSKSSVTATVLSINVKPSKRRHWTDINTSGRQNNQILDSGRPGDGGNIGPDGREGGRRRGTGSRSNSLLLLILTAASVIVFILVVTIFALVYLRKIPCQGSTASKHRRRPPGEKEKGSRQEELFPIQTRPGGLDIEKITDDNIAVAKFGEKTLRKGLPPSYSSTEKGSAPSLLDRQVSGGGNYSFIPTHGFETLERRCGSGESAEVEMNLGTGKLSRKCYRPAGAESHAYTELEVRDVLLPEFGPSKDCPTYQNTLKSNWGINNSNTAQRTPVITSSFV